MSQRLIDHNADLKRLRDEGYAVEVRRGYVLIHNIPYVNSSKEVRLGTLVSTLHMSGETILRPDTHVAYFVGEYPCRKDGAPISQLRHQDSKVHLDEGLTVDRSFSNKPVEGYEDYYHKMSTYAEIISAPAQSIDPLHTPKQFIAIKSDEAEPVFEYIDTASSRAGIKKISRALEVSKVSIIGLGGTGSYILDLLAKTPVRGIDLFDGDRFYSHNAFRSPGAASLNDLEKQELKVQYFANYYSRMRRGIIAHPVFINSATERLLDGSDFAFVAVDGGDNKKSVLEALERRGIDYIDCGIGVDRTNDRLTGQVRVTTSLSGYRDHVWNKGAIPFSDEDVDNAYSQNIQIADLNALNAALAVIRWKRLRGFYLDLERELQSLYPVDGNVIINAHQIEKGEEQ